MRRVVARRVVERRSVVERRRAGVSAHGARGDGAARTVLCEKEQAARMRNCGQMYNTAMISIRVRFIYKEKSVFFLVRIAREGVPLRRRKGCGPMQILWR